MPAAIARVATARPRRSAIATLMLVAVAVLALGISHVARRHQVIRLGYQLSEQTVELRRLEEENRRLRLERSMLRHPDRIERYAQHLGMIRPDPRQIRVVAPSATTVAAQ